ncbi:glycerate kinase, partial [Acinetobacter baumannii]|nr:glycerate kinase [Acinetobacter baumannii]
ALRVLQRYGIQTPEPVHKLLSQPAGPVESTANSEVKLIATPQRALQAAALVACRHGLTPLILGDALEGESREVAIVMA